MATDLSHCPTQDVLGEINKYDFITPSHAVFKAATRPECADRLRDFGDEAGAGVDARFPAALAQDLRVEADAALGRQYRHRLPGHLLLPEADRPPGQDLGRCAGRDQGNVRQAGHSRGREEVSRRREGSVRERSRLRLAARKTSPRRAFSSPTPIRPCASIRDLVREYFGTIIPPEDNKFAALNSAVWSGGSFIYVPKGVKIEFPLQAYFRINAERMGQFERTLIIVDEGAEVHYVEGCTAPMYTSESLHSAVVEIVVRRGARCRYTTIQNWANNIYNLVTKRAVAYGDSLMEWIDGNLGSRLTMKYPAVYMMEPGARGEILSIAFASKGQHQDAGAKVVHCAPHTKSRIISQEHQQERRPQRAIAVCARCRTAPSARRATSSATRLILDPASRSDTYPYIEVEEQDVQVEHEASVSRIGEEQLFYLQSRGLTEAEASSMIVSGFIEPLIKELPMEYAVEMNRLIELQMEGSVG